MELINHLQVRNGCATPAISLLICINSCRMTRIFKPLSKP